MNCSDIMLQWVSVCENFRKGHCEVKLVVLTGGQSPCLAQVRKGGRLGCGGGGVYDIERAKKKFKGGRLRKCMCVSGVQEGSVKERWCCKQSQVVCRQYQHCPPASITLFSSDIHIRVVGMFRRGKKEREKRDRQKHGGREKMTEGVGDSCGPSLLMPPIRHRRGALHRSVSHGVTATTPSTQRHCVAAFLSRLLMVCFCLLLFFPFRHFPLSHSF